MEEESDTESTDINIDNDDLLSLVSHEIKSPLTSILSILTLLSETRPLTVKQKEYIDILSHCSVSLSTIINNVLDTHKLKAKKLSLTISPFNLTEVIDRLYGMFKEKARLKGIEYTIDIRDSVPKQLIGDITRISQVLTNLISNSIKYTESGSVKLLVYSENIELELQENNTIPNISRKHAITFEVTDTGIGIPAEYLPSLFTRYIQANPSVIHIQQGTGLGLYIVKQLVDLMNGSITVNSEYGKGSVFTVTLELTEDIDITALQEKHTEILNISKVIVVDDRIEMRILLNELLHKLNVTVFTVSSARECIMYMEHQIFDLALIDIKMQDISGVQLALTMREKYPSVPLIGLSSISIDQDQQAIFDYFLYKPIDSTILYPVVISCLLNKPNYSLKRQNSRERKNRDNLNILIVEDNTVNAYSLTELLLSLGFKTDNIHHSKNGQEALEYFYNSDIGIDIVFTDLIMPRMDGFVLCKRLRKKGYVGMICAMSASVSSIEKCSFGFSSILQKPFTRANLENIILPLLTEDGPISPTSSCSSENSRIEMI